MLAVFRGFLLGAEGIGVMTGGLRARTRVLFRKVDDEGTELVSWGPDEMRRRAAL